MTTLRPALRDPARTAIGLPYAIVDDFLSRTMADGLLAQIIAVQDRFAPALLQREGADPLDRNFRSALRLPGRVGVDLAPLIAAIVERGDALCDAIGIRPFPVHHREMSIVAHRGGDFYKRHIDTGAPQDGHVRVVSCVYYLHWRPRGFSGGALAIHPLTGDGPPRIVEPVHNRLAVFASFVPHEVLPTIGAGAFAESRFSINCWLRRQVRPAAA